MDCTHIWIKQIKENMTYYGAKINFKITSFCQRFESLIGPKLSNSWNLDFTIIKKNQFRKKQ